MPDIRIVNVSDLSGVVADWLLTPTGALDERDVLANVVKLALMTDGRAADDDILPDPDSQDRRGWWGDSEASVIWGGWPIGCKNWLLARSKITNSSAREGSTLVRVEEYCRAALQPMIERGLCSQIDITAVRNGLDRIDVTVIIYRGPKDEISLVFQSLWTELGG